MKKLIVLLTIFATTLLCADTAQLKSGRNNFDENALENIFALRNVSIFYSSDSLRYEITSNNNWTGRIFTPSGNRAVKVCGQWRGRNDLLNWTDKKSVQTLTTPFTIATDFYDPSLKWKVENRVPPKKGDIYLYTREQGGDKPIIADPLNNLQLDDKRDVSVDWQGGRSSFVSIQPKWTLDGKPLTSCNDYKIGQTVAPITMPYGTTGICLGDIGMSWVPIFTKKRSDSYASYLLNFVMGDADDINIKKMQTKADGTTVPIMFTPTPAPAQTCDQANSLGLPPVVTVELKNNQIVIALQACPSSLDSTMTLNLVKLKDIIVETVGPVQAAGFTDIDVAPDNICHAELSFSIDANAYEITEVSVAVYRGVNLGGKVCSVQYVHVFSQGELLNKGVLTRLQ